MTAPASRIGTATSRLRAVLLAAATALPTVAAAQDVAPDAPAGPSNPPPPAAFLFELPGEVKTGLMVLLAVFIGIYLWRNLSRGD